MTPLHPATRLLLLEKSEKRVKKITVFILSYFLISASDKLPVIKTENVNIKQKSIQSSYKITTNGRKPLLLIH